MKIAVIIVTFLNTNLELTKLKKQFKKLINLQNKDFIIINNSKNNIGFGAAVNLGLKKIFKFSYDLAIIANPDIELIKLSLEQIKKARKKFEIFGGVFTQNKQVYYGGIIDKRSFSAGLRKIKSKKILFKTDFVSGSLMFISKKAYEINNLFKENYFLYYEDAEYCYRAKQNKLNVGINNKIKYKHLEKSNELLKKEFYLTRNRLFFLKEYGYWSQKIYQYLKIPYKVICLFTNPNQKNIEKIKGYFAFIKS